MSTVSGLNLLSVIVLPFASLTLTNLSANNCISFGPSSFATADATFGPKYFCTSNNGSPIPPPPPSVINLKSSISITSARVVLPGSSDKSFTLFKNSLAFALTTGLAASATPAFK